MTYITVIGYYALVADEILFFFVLLSGEFG